MVIASNDDLRAMYRKYPHGDINLWCDGKHEEGAGKLKRKREELPSKFHEREEEVEDIYKEIKERHSDIPKLRLWAHMISSNLHESLDDPPRIPAFGCAIKRPCQESLSNALSGAIAMAHAFSDGGKKSNTPDQKIVCQVCLSLLKQTLANSGKLFIATLSKIRSG